MKTLLVIEDDANIRSAMKALLESEGYRILTAENGEDAKAVLAQSKPDLILLDLYMPVLCGRGFLIDKAARELVGTTPVIIMSASHTDTPKGVAFISKPMSCEELFNTIADALLNPKCPQWA